MIGELPQIGPDPDARLIARAQVAIMVYRELGQRAPSTNSGKVALKRAERLLSKTMLDLIKDGPPAPMPEEAFVPTGPSRRRVPVAADGE